MKKAPKDCEIDFRPMTTYRGRPCQKAALRWNDGFDFVLRKLRSELISIGAPDAIVETWHRREDYTLSGRPRAGAEPSRPEVQVWFKAGTRPVCVPSGKFRLWTENLKAVAMTLERQRLILDYGCFTLEEQFAAHAALPAGQAIAAGEFATVEEAIRFVWTTARPGAIFDDRAVRSVITIPGRFTEIYRCAAKMAHPDAGGSEALMRRLNAARDMIEREGRR